MPTGIQVSGSILVGTQKPTDARYGPYASTSAALSDLTPVYRYKGLTVGIETGGVITEYWFNDGIQDTDFVVKSLDPNADIATSGIDTTSGSPVLTTADRVLYNANGETVATFATNFDLRKPLEFGGTSGATNAATSRANLNAAPILQFNSVNTNNTGAVISLDVNRFYSINTLVADNRELQLPQSGTAGDRIIVRRNSGTASAVITVTRFTGSNNWQPLATLTQGQCVSFSYYESSWVVEFGATYRGAGTIAAGAAGVAGLVPAPAASDSMKFLKGDGTWADVTGATQVQADWDETDNTQPDFIKNKPTVPDTGFTIAMALAL